MVKCNEKIVARIEQTKQGNFEGLFNSQIAILEDRDIPEPIIKALQNQKDSVLKRASKMTIGKGNLPFLPIITPIYLGYCGLMSKVRNGFFGIGYSSIIPEAIIDGFGTPDSLYYIYDVEVGKATMSKSPAEACKIFKKQSRSSMTAVEVINLCITTTVLWRRSVLATSSRYVINEQTPIVFLDDHNNPVLGCFYDAHGNDRWGSPSCGSR